MMTPEQDDAFRRIAESALLGARQDPREDKSDWIRIWAKCQQARGMPWSPWAWANSFQTPVDGFEQWKRDQGW